MDRVVLPRWMGHDRPKARQLNRLAEACERNSDVQPGIGIVSSTTLGSYALPEETFFARILSSISGSSIPEITKHAFEEVVLQEFGLLEPVWVTNSTGVTSSDADGYAYAQPLYDTSGRRIATGEIVLAKKGWGDYYLSATPVVDSPTVSNKRKLVWYTNYLHVEDVLFSPGQVVGPGVKIAEIAVPTAATDFGGTGHLHWGLGDGVQDIYPSGNYLSSVGQTVDMVDYFADTWAIPTGSPHSGTVQPPARDSLFTADQLTKILARSYPPIPQDVGFEAHQSSNAHTSYEYYAIDFAIDLTSNYPSADPDSNKAVYNAINPSTTDVITTVMSVEAIDENTNPASPNHRIGYQVILRHEYLPEAEPDDIPLVGAYTINTNTFLTSLGYFSNLAFSNDFPLTRSGSFLRVGTPTAKVEVVKNSGAVVSTRNQLNFIEGSGITLTVADDAINDQADITIASSTPSLEGIFEGYLSLEDGVAFSTTNQTAKSTLYLVPVNGTGSQVGLSNGTTCIYYTLTQRSLDLSALSNNTNYDIWLYDNSGTLTLAHTAWTNDTTRATALTTVNGFYVKSGATTYRYVGTIRTSAAGQCEDSDSKRFVWNYYNRRLRYLQKEVNSSSHTYNSSAWRAWNNDTTNRFSYVIGVLEETGHFGIGSDLIATSAGDVPKITAAINGTASGTAAKHTIPQMSTVSLSGPLFFPSAGYHYLEAQEACTTGSGTFDDLFFWSTFFC